MSNVLRNKIIAGGLATLLMAGGVAVNEKTAESKRLHFRKALVSYNMSSSTADKISLRLKDSVLNRIIGSEKPTHREFKEYVRVANRALKDLPVDREGRHIIPTDNKKIEIADIILKGYTAKNL